MEDSKKWLYDALSKKGYDLGDYKEYETHSSEPESQKWLYDNSVKAGLDVGSFDEFKSGMGFNNVNPATANVPLPLNIGERPEQGELAAKYELPTSSLKTRIDKAIDETGNWKEERELDKKQMPDFSKLDTYKIKGERFDREKLLAPADNVQQNDNTLVPLPLEKEPLTGVQPKNTETKPQDITSTAKPYLGSYENIRDHYFSRFSMTDQGKQAQADLAETQKDFTDILVAKLKESQTYKDIMSSTAAPADKDKAIQALWEKECLPVLDKQMQPFFNEYSNQMMKRYSLEMGNDIKKLDQSIARNSWESIGGRIAEYEGELKKRKGGWRNASSPTYESNVARIQREANSKDFNEKSRQVSAARSMMEGSQKMIEAADAEAGSNFFEGLGRGFKDEAFNLDNWTMGLKGLADGQACLNVLEKCDKKGPESLNKEEQLLMDAMVSNAATQAYFQSELGRGYKAGSVTGISLPFMVDMLTGVAVVSSGTKAATKGLMKWIAKNYTKNAVQKNIAKGVTGLTKGIVDSAIHTASFGMGRVASDYTQREIGNVQFETGPDGPQYAGREGAESGIGTVGKAFVSTGLETQSELIGNQFAPALKFVSKQIMRLPGLKNIPASKVGEYIKDMYNSASVKGIREFAKHAQFQGPVAEYAEEFYNNLGSVVIGDMTPEQLVDVDQNIDTFLGVGVMSAAFGLVGTGAFIREKYKTGKEIKSFEEKTKEHIDFDRLKADLQKQDIQGARDLVKQVMNDSSLSADEKKEEIRYIANVLKEAAMNSAESENGKESLFPDDIEENKSTIYSEFETTRKNLENSLPPETVNRIDAGEDINSIILTGELSEEQQDAIIDYQASKADFDDYLTSVRNKVADARESARKEVEGVSNPDMGAVVRVTSNLSPDPVHIVGGKLTFDEEGFVDEGNSSDIIYYINENGQRKELPSSAFVSLVDMNDTESIAQQAETDAEMQIIAEEQAQLPQEYVPAVGDKVSTREGIKGEIIRFTPEGNAIVSDEEKDYVVPLNNILLQNEAINEESAPSGESNVSQSENESIASSVPMDTPSSIDNEPVPVEDQSVAVSPIPVDDKGNLLYHKAKIEDTIADLTDGALDDNEVDEFVSANRKEAMDNLAKLEKKLPKMGTNKAKYLQDKAAHKAKMEEEQQRIAYWNSVEKEIKSMREKPGDAVAEEILSMEEPMTGEEFAARQLANGNLPLLQSSFGEETGFGKDEIKKYFGLFSSADKGGMTIQEAGEALMQSDRENGTNFFDQNDPNAGRDAIINVLSQATTRSDLANIIKKNREEAAERERAAEYEAYETFTQESFHMTPQEYEAHEEVALPVQIEKYQDVDVDILFNDIINNKNGRQEEGIAGSDVILQGEGVVPTGRIGTSENVEGQIESSLQGGVEDGALQESTPTEEIKPVGKGILGNIFNQFKGKANEAIAFLLNRKEGDAVAALHHKEIGDIDLYWGNEKAGLMKIAKKHPEVLDDLQGIIDEMTIKQQSENRIVLESSTHKAIVSKMLGNTPTDNWLLSAYEKKEKSVSASSSDIETEPEGKKNGTATLQSELSYDKDNTLLEEMQENIDNLSDSEEFAAQDSQEFSAPSIEENENILDYASRIVSEKEMHDVRRSVNPNPTEAQKEAGNYKKGHVKIDGYNVTIENPKGSVRSGKDANGQEWSITMNNDYGYIRGTKAVDGDHIDIFLSDNPTEGNVFVVDQLNEDGSFDESKVMYGFASADEARSAYLSNYSPEWESRIGAITEVSKDKFKKWIDSSVRKTKPFSEYKSVKVDVPSDNVNASNIREDGMIIDEKGKAMVMYHGTENTAITSLSQLEGGHRRIDGEKAAFNGEGIYFTPDENVARDYGKNILEANIKLHRPYILYGVLGMADKKAQNFTNKLRSEGYDGIITYQSKQMREIGAGPIEVVVFSNKSLVPIQEKQNERTSTQNRLVTDERYAELRERMRKKLGGQMNIGIDPEILAIGTEMAVYHIEKGARKFAEYAKAMINDLGDEIRPYLKSFYNGARELPEMEEAGLADKMDSYDEVRQIDTTGIGRTLNTVETAETIVKEQEVEKQVSRAKSTTKKPSQISKKDKNVVPLQGQINDLFNEQFNEDETVQGLVGSATEGGTARQPSDKNGEMGTGKRNEAERAERNGMDNRSSSDVRNDRERSGRTSELSERKQRLKEERKNQRNNHAERGTDYAPKSPSARFKANVDAIRTLREIEESGKLATPQQIESLRKFSGWGGISMNSEAKEYQELSQLLTPEELKDAELSGNTSYYTPAGIIDAMWDVVTKLGFNGGKVLEGSAGIGNIIGSMPEEVSRHSDIQAVEIDRITGGILRALYPDAKVDVKGFQDVDIPAGSVDLAITNVPFITGLSVIDKKNPDLSKKFKNIHDFCIAKNVRSLREGGIGIFISTSGTMDKSTELRKWITQQGNADFIGAFRLNNETFVGTKVTSDIIVIRKRINGKPSSNSIDVQGVSAIRKVDYVYDKSFNRTTHTWEDVTKPLVMIMNSYFEQHPNHMGGAMKFGFEVGETFRPESSGLYPDKNDANQDEKLKNWIEQFKEEQAETIKQERISNEKTDERTGTMVVNSKGELCQVMYGEKVPLDINDNKVKGYTKAQCLEDYKAIRDAVNAVLDYQTNNEDDKGLAPLLSKLNNAYDAFVGKYGTLNRNTSVSFLKNDVDFPSLAALETYKEIKTIDGKTTVFTSKADIFQKRMIGFESEPKPQNITEGVITSIYKHGNINLDYISEKLSMPVEQVKHEILDKRLGFENPATGGVEVDYEYLSGNVREKLAIATANNTDGKLNANIEELQKVIPMDIPAHLIEFSIGSSWIEPKIFEDFFNEKYAVNLNCAHIGDTWVFNNKKGEYNEKNRLAGVYSKMCNKLISGSTLAEAAMNNLTIKVQTTQTSHDAMGNKTTETITDKEATQSCARRTQEIKDEFKEWARAKMQQDEELAERMSRVYNDKFNALVPKRISKQFLPERFKEASNGIKLYRHQKQAVVRGTTQNLMLAHEVGTGKTFTLISIAMEMRRLGTAKKPCIVVQNATVQQFVNDAKKLYPNAKILTLEENDRNPEGRMKFYAKIKYNDWDMIVIPQSVLNLMPDSETRKNEFINEKLEEKQHILDLMEQAGADEKELKNAQRELQNMQEAFAEGDMATALSGGRKKSKGKDKKKEAVSKEKAKNKAERQLNRRTDEVTDFDDMGIDAILVDEAHNYKRLGFSTAIKGVKGIDIAGSTYSVSLYLKTRSVMEKSGGKNVIFATGTPISNTAAEIWTFMKYLLPKETMEANDMYYFDDFVRNFGNINQMVEFATNGKFKENTRFAAYINKPELIRIWATTADTVLTKDAESKNGEKLSDKLPVMETGKAQDIFLPQTKGLRRIMKFVKVELEKYEQMSGKEKKEHSSIPLVMFGIAKRAAIDPRLVDSNAEDEPGSKVNRAVEETLKSLKQTDSYHGTIAIFCDQRNGVNGFDLFHELKNKLVEKGISPDKVVVMESGMSNAKKQKIFDAVNSGEVRVIIGTTASLGTGVNIQERLHTLIHMDAPNRPMDYMQRNGRILRQGNLHKEWNKEVRVLRFGVEDSLDVTAYQRLKTKAGFIDSIMDGKSALDNNQVDRVLEEEEEGLFDNPVAVLSGSEYAILKTQAEREYRKYSSRKQQYEQDQVYIGGKIKRNTAQINANYELIAEEQNTLNIIQQNFPAGKVKCIYIGNVKCADDAALEVRLTEINKMINESADAFRKDSNQSAMDIPIHIRFDKVDVQANIHATKKSEYVSGKGFAVRVSKQISYTSPALGIEDAVKIGGGYIRGVVDEFREEVATGNIQRENIEGWENANKRMVNENEMFAERYGKPFEFEKELEQAKKQVGEYDKLMQEELKAKEEKYKDEEVEGSFDLNKAVDAVFDEETPEKSEARLRESDENIDDISGRPDEEIISSVEKLADKLHTPVRIVSNKDLLPEGDAKRAIEKGRNIKGWFEPTTGEVVIYLPNASNEDDAARTVLHEVVSHYGLRKMFGKDFDTFLDNVYANAEESIQKNIDARGGDKRIATEEYLSELAERGFEDEERTLWQKIKDFFIDMLRKAGVDLGFKLGDNELRYILWKSYQNLNDNNIFDIAKDVAKQYEWNVGNYRFRETDQDKASDGSREAYEKSVKGNKYKFLEAYQDSMLSLKKLQEVISEISGKPIQAFENAYMAENQLSSKNTAESEKYYNEYFEPLEKEIAHLIKSGAISYDKLSDYIILKHGVERNIEFSVRDAIKSMEKDEGTEVAKQTREDYETDKADLRKNLEDGVIGEDEYLPKLEEIGIKYAGSINDYSATRTLLGKLTGGELPNNVEGNKRTDAYISMFEDNYGEDADIMTLANDAIKEFESKFDAGPLWKKMNEATKHPLRKSYESGLMSKESYEHTNKMFRFYVPLRGWDEKTADDVYEYLSSERSPVNSVLATAKGRKSIPDNPIPVIGNMAESTILQGNRNLMKQSFMSMVMNHPTDVATIKKAWYVKDPSSDEWIVSYPNIEENDSAQDIDRKIEEHEERMNELEETGGATQKTQGLNINYRIGNAQAKEHVVSVKRNGKEYLIFINGNPRAAQAVNGMTNPDVEKNPVMKALGVANRWLSANFTTRNPAFVLSNLSRDLIFAQSAVLVKESPEYAGKFFLNAPKAMKAIMSNLSGKSNPNKEINRYFKEFIENGGETGYMTLTDVDKYKKKVKHDLERLSGNEASPKKVLRWCVDRLEDFNRWAEDVSRFTTYMTSRQMGRSITESVNDAKEITVNFNKKGAGLKTEGLFGISAGLFRGLYLFFNAGVQSLANFGRLAKGNPVKFGAALGGFTAAGFIVPALVNQFLIAALGGGDDDPYKDLPDWIRRNNLCLYCGSGKFVTIPLPIELRAFYGLGDMAYQYTTAKGRIKPTEMSYDMANQITELLPLNPLGHNGDIISTLMPDALKPFWQINQNKDFTGKPIYKKTPFNELDPEFKRVYKGTSGWLVDASQFFNDISGGSDFRKGIVDMNPAKVEHLFESYFGGMGKTFNQLGKSLWYGAKSIAEGEKNENLKLRNVPALNRFITEIDERSAFSGINKEYYRMVDEFETIDHEVNGLTQKASLMNPKYLDEYTRLTETDRFKWYRRFKQIKENIDKMYETGKVIPDEEAKKEIEMQILDAKRSAVFLMKENGKTTNTNK